MHQHAEVAGVEWSEGHWARDFAQRMALAEPDDTLRGVFCNALLRVMRERGGEAVGRRCLEAAGEEKFVDFFNYRITTYLRMVSTGLELLVGKHEDVEELLRQLGREAVVELGRSAAGKALEVMNTGKTRSMLAGLRVVYRVAVSFGELELENTGPTSVRLTMKRVFMPLAFHEGVLSAALEAHDIKGARVCGRQVGPLSNAYEISWE